MDGEDYPLAIFNSSTEAMIRSAPKCPLTARGRSPCFETIERQEIEMRAIEMQTRLIIRFNTGVERIEMVIPRAPEPEPAPRTPYSRLTEEQRRKLDAIAESMLKVRIPRRHDSTLHNCANFSIV
jgi:hypothetical protein